MVYIFFCSLLGSIVSRCLPGTTTCQRRRKSYSIALNDTVAIDHTLCSPEAARVNFGLIFFV